MSPTGSSALEHTFGLATPYALTIEEEAMLLDPETFDLAQRVDSVLESAGGDLPGHVAPELMQSSIGVATSTCATAGDLATELRRLRSGLAAIAHERGLRLGVAGTHPFSLFESQRISTHERHRTLVDQLQYIARRELVFGLHVHVAVPSPELALRIADGLAVELAPLLALSASSPFWRGEATGLASSRRMVTPPSHAPARCRTSRTTRSSPPSSASSRAPAASRTAPSSGRPNPRLGTVEIRICDAVTGADDAVAIAAYCQAAVKALAERCEQALPLPSHHRVLTGENVWLAARHGLAAPVIDLATGWRNRVPIAQLIRRSLRELEGHARELGCERELTGISAILGHGNGSDRQLRVFTANRDIVEVARTLADDTETTIGTAPAR